jgi:hypothetical protein
MLFGAGALTIGNLFYAKLIGFGGAAGLQYYSAKETYFYFRNAGYRIRQVIASAFAIDFILFAIIITIYLIIK